MLIPKPVSIGEVVVLKMTNGQEVFGKLISNTAGTITLGNPLSMLIEQNQAGFVPFVMGAEDVKELAFPSDKILIGPLKARKDIASAFSQATSNLVLPESTLITA